MELVAWSSHKYVMHGFLWKWHKDHHRLDNMASTPEKIESQRFEKNDLFFIIYALPAIVLLIIGISGNNLYLISLSVGITLYGLTYFLIHDMVIHKRLNTSLFDSWKNRYLKAIIKAHSAHHHAKTKQDFHNYGLLVFSFRYFK